MTASQTKTQRILAWTDGSARPTNPGYGGWAYVIDHRPSDKVYTEYAWMPHGTTNNLAELRAIRLCLLKATALTPSVPLIVTSDSQWAVCCINGDYKAKCHVEEIRMIQHHITTLQDVKIQWARGHAGQVYNELVDKMANLATRVPNVIQAQVYERENFLEEGNEFLRKFESFIRTA